MNNEESTVKKEQAWTYYVRHPKYSYGIFCINQSGDFFINSDWGMYGTCWRAYGGDFKAFLISANAEYIFDKLDTNMRYLLRKDLPKHVKAPMLALIDAFREELKKEIVSEVKPVLVDSKEFIRQV